MAEIVLENVSKSYAGGATAVKDLSLTIADLPPPSTQRWVMRRKAEVVTAVRAGLISLEDACARYGLTHEEFLGWQKALDRHGMKGLSTTRIQHYRKG